MVHFYVYMVVCMDPKVQGAYSGVTRDLEMSNHHHRECSLDGQRYFYRYVRENGGWDKWLIFPCSIHDTYEEAKARKIPGSLNVYETVPNVPTIYTIRCRDPNVTDFYVGQTVNFESRRDAHFVSSLHKSLKLYDCIRENGGWSNWKMERVREYPHCVDKTELDRLEWYWWNKLGATLNSVRPGNPKERKDRMESYEQMVVENSPRETFFGRTISLDV